MKDQYGFDRMRIDRAEVVQVIQVNATIGDGTANDPCRHVYRYYSLDGNLLATKDGWLEENEDKP